MYKTTDSQILKLKRENKGGKCVPLKVLHNNHKQFTINLYKCDACVEASLTLSFL